MITGESIEVKDEHIDVHPPLGFTLSILALVTIPAIFVLAITG